MKLEHVLEICLYCKDLHQAEQFYGGVLGFKVHSRLENRHIFFRCGNSMLLIFNPDKTTVKGQNVPSHGMYGKGHVAFAIKEEEMSNWRDHLLQKGVEIESEIIWPDGGRSLYFRDFDDNSIELATPDTWGITL